MAKSIPGQRIRSDGRRARCRRVCSIQSAGTGPASKRGPIVRSIVLSLCVGVAAATSTAAQVSEAAAEDATENPRPVADRESFEALLQQAEELSISEPWPRSQALLDRLRRSLEAADDAQYARFALMEIRNLALDGRIDSALDRLDQLLALNLPPEWRLRALSLGANIAQIARRYRETFSYLNQALELLHNGMAEGSHVYSLAATMFASVGERDRAIEYGRLGFELARQRGDRDACAAQLRLGLVYRELGELDTAYDQYQQASDSCRASGDPILLHAMQFRLAEAMVSAGSVQRAGNLFEQAIEGMQRVGYEFGLAEARLFYARFEARMERPERVEILLRPAIKVFEDDENWQYLSECYQLLAESARDMGELDRAVDLYERLMEIRTLKDQHIRTRQTAFLEVQFNSRHAEQQLERLRDRQRMERLRVDAQTQRTDLRYWVYGTFAAMVAVLALLLYRASRERRRFQGLSERDALTSLSNHTRFFKLAEKTLELSREKGIPYTLVLGDIDHFKQVNDRYGHQTGDSVLRRISARLREHFSNHGIIGRIGGEEFGIALPGMDVDQVEEQLQVFRRAMAESRHDDPPVEITMSFGVARPRADESLTEIRERADRGLYQAKNAGRDRIVVVNGRS